jgi:dehydrogenase/reductase SDR family protein 1
MTSKKSGLIVNISSLGGWQFLFNVPYCVGKSACDRMATDCAVDLKKENVAMVSLWPGPAKTEYVQNNMGGKGKSTDKMLSASKKSKI